MIHSSHEMLSFNRRTICSNSGKHPTTLYGSKTSSGRKPEEITSDGNIKGDNKTSSASVSSVNMGSNVINMSVVPVEVGYEGTEQIKLFLPMPCLTIAAKAHLSQKILRTVWE